uniref:aldehyde dehydrogenase family protein n=1 Tax=Roseateles sp. TaxID=1971397 RepID=UPI00286A5C3B
INKQYDLFINGEWQKPLSNKYFDTINPANEEKLSEVAEANVADVNNAVKAARNAYEKVWKKMPAKERAKYIFRIARMVQEKARELAIIESLDGGKPIRESRDFDVPTAANSTGRALRAVADDHQAAQSIGIPLSRIWVIVWSVAGFVALVAGIIWGSKLGVQFSLSLVAMKALPVVILGGLTSVPGAIIGGLIIGVGEKLSEVFIGPYFGGGIEIWFGYVLVLLVLLVRPQGLFGEKIIDRV